MTYLPCPVCKSPSTSVEVNDEFKVDCFRCGKFAIDGTSRAILSTHLDSHDKRCNASSYIYQNQGARIDRDYLMMLKSLGQPLVSTRAYRLLAALCRFLPRVNQQIQIVPNELNLCLEKIETREAEKDYADDSKISGFIETCRAHLPLLSASWSLNCYELWFLMNDFLVECKGYLRKNGSVSYAISASGWEFLEHGTTAQESNDVFVAMSFDPSLDEFYQQVIAEGIREAGYNPVRVDRTDHVNKIDDEIISLIRKAKFVIADFTQQKSGVYFEAGFALGFELRVIWMCRNNDLSNVHFDTRQYNIIIWEDERPFEAKRALRNRIEANFGRGKLVL